MIKLVYCIRRKPEMSRGAFREYWRGPHASLVKSVARQIGAFRYVQSHAFVSAIADHSNAIRGSTMEPFDGITEFWWQEESDLLRPAGSTLEQVIQAQKLLLADECEFIDLEESSIFLGEEREIFDFSGT